MTLPLTLMHFGTDSKFEFGLLVVVMRRGRVRR